MHDSTRLHLTVRRTGPADRDKLLDVVHAAFGYPEKHQHFMKLFPYYFTDDRMRECFLCEVDGRAVGAAGVYPYTYRQGGVSFRVAGIGQVACIPEFRGKGVMTATLNAALRHIAEERFDFTWLAGDRTRYSHFGWTLGGRMLLFRVSRRSLGEFAPPEVVRPLDLNCDFPAVRTHLDGLPATVAVAEDEMASRLAAQRVEGWIAGNAFILLAAGGRRVLAGRGDASALKRLFALQLHRMEMAPPQDGSNAILEVETSAASSDLASACRESSASLAVYPCTCLRVGPLAILTEKITRMAGVLRPYGDGRIGLVNTDTGDGVSIGWRDGEWQVSAGALDGACRLQTLQLSELFFGWPPVDDLLPGLPADSPVRALFPMPVHIAQLFGV